jgi:hypothetical protein
MVEYKAGFEDKTGRVQFEQSRKLFMNGERRAISQVCH